MANHRPRISFDGGDMRLTPHGAQRFSGAASGMIDDLTRILSSLPIRPAGTRLFGFSSLAPLLAMPGPIALLAESLLGAAARPVRALMFGKRATSNWSLGWHQDRVVAVNARLPVARFTNWTVKNGVAHASPPWELLSQMLTLRIHLDPVPPDNSPLLVAPGSHRLGLIPEPSITETVRACGVIACLADAGDIWAYSTPILHASEATATDRRRRVLQLDYAAFDLPGALSWRGV